MSTVLKLGGSVLTEKDRPETIDERALETATEAIASVGASDLVIVHGGGSFGHHYADSYGVTDEQGTHNAGGIYEIHEAMGRLNSKVIEALQARNVPALPVSPLSVASREADGTTTLPADVIERMHEEGFVPVLYGDVVVQRGAGATILSGDEIVVLLARALAADRVGLCSSVPGVLDESGSVIDRIDDFASVAGALGESGQTDVTGGMAAKVRALLSIQTPASIFGPEDLAAFLAGENPGTTIASDR